MSESQTTRPDLQTFVIDRILEYETLRKRSLADKEDQNSYGAGFDSGYLHAMRDVRAILLGEFDEE